MENPFESGHIKNYVLLYSSVVVIMVLFFIASTLFNEVDEVEQKVFNTDTSALDTQEEKRNIEVDATRFKLMPKTY